MLKTKGIHHITAIVGDPQINIDFYTTVLGLRLVKKTVNYDDPATYHLYFGNETGQPGTILTFFPWPGAYGGSTGAGMVGTISFVVPKGALDFWKKQLAQFGVPTEQVSRFGEEFLQFRDPHGLNLELVARAEGTNSLWKTEEISPDVAIKGFGGAFLLSDNPLQTMALLGDIMGMEKIGEEVNVVRFRADGDMGNIIDIRNTRYPQGIMGAGTVHHIAWRAPDNETQIQWQSELLNRGFQPTEVKDRQYFNSVYFREFGSILFEIATDPPGLHRDETVEFLGQELKLPPWLESSRAKIEDALPAIEVPSPKDD